MNQFFGLSFSRLRWLILLIFPLGWYGCIEYFAGNITWGDKFTDLTVMSGVASAVILYHLKGKLKQEAPLWIMYLIFIIGHHVQSYLIIYWWLNRSIGLKIFLADLVAYLPDRDLIINTYSISTISICAFAATVYLLWNNKSNQTLVNSQIADVSLNKVANVKLVSWLMVYIVFLIAVGGLLLFLMFDLRLGARVDPHTGFGAVTLPYKMAGIITISTKLLVPAIFLMLIFIADCFKDKLSLRVATTSYIAHSAILTVISPSRGLIPGAIASLGMIWAFSGNLNAGRRNLILASLPLFPIFFGIATRLRLLREIGNVGQFSDLPIAINQVFEDLSQYVYFPLIRINGINTLIFVEKSNPLIHMSTIYQRLWELNFDVNALYKEQVLNINAEGFGISPGLTGCLYLLSGNQWIVALGVALHTIFWYKLFCRVLSLQLYTKPIALAQMTLLSGFFTSAGSFNVIPLHTSIIFASILFGEVFIKFLMGIPIKILTK